MTDIDKFRDDKFSVDSVFQAPSFNVYDWDLFLPNNNDITDAEQSELESANGKLLLPGSAASDPMSDGQT
jgi:hypothetical protein